MAFYSLAAIFIILLISAPAIYIYTEFRESTVREEYANTLRNEMGDHPITDKIISNHGGNDSVGLHSVRDTLRPLYQSINNRKGYHGHN